MQGFLGVVKSRKGAGVSAAVTKGAVVEGRTWLFLK
jgi:hypothetical protein